MARYAPKFNRGVSLKSSLQLGALVPLAILVAGLFLNLKRETANYLGTAEFFRAIPKIEGSKELESANSAYVIGKTSATYEVKANKNTVQSFYKTNFAERRFVITEGDDTIEARNDRYVVIIKTQNPESKDETVYSIITGVVK